jgi:uncharacterized membrane protein YccF (DUF307 family)
MKINKRILQLFWGAFGMGLAFFIDSLLTNIGIFNLPTDWTIVLGVIIPVITKAIRNSIV